MERWKEKWNDRMMWLAVAWGVILLWGLLMGCASKRVTEVLQVHDTVRVHQTDTVRLVSWKSDTLRVKDSVTVTLKESGETVRVAVFRDRWQYRWLRDTVRLAVHDTVYKAAVTEKEKEVVWDGWFKAWGWKVGLVLLMLALFIKRLKGGG